MPGRRRSLNGVSVAVGFGHRLDDNPFGGLAVSSCVEVSFNVGSGWIACGIWMSACEGLGKHDQ